MAHRNWILEQVHMSSQEMTVLRFKLKSWSWVQFSFHSAHLPLVSIQRSRTKKMPLKIGRAKQNNICTWRATNWTSSSWERVSEKISCFSRYFKIEYSDWCSIVVKLHREKIALGSNRFLPLPHPTTSLPPKLWKGS